MHSPEHPTIRRDLQLKTQRAIFEHVLPALHAAIHEVTGFVLDEDDDDEVREHLRELATETVIDELVSLLTRDAVPISRQRMINDVDGIGIDTLIACYNELMPDHAQLWYAQRAGMNADEHTAALDSLPNHIQW